MGDDWLLVSIDEIQAAGAHLRDLLGDVTLLDRVRDERAAGATVPEILDWFAATGRERRVATAEAIARYEHAVMMFRGRIVRSMVDDEGIAISEVARRMGISRQMGSRLYQAAVADDRGGIGT